VGSTGGADHGKAIAASNVSHPNTGTYCFGQLPISANNAVATLDSSGSAVGIDAQVGDGSAEGCPAGTQVFVLTFNVHVNTANGNVDTEPFEDNGFYININ
jgi:hypothetical protein